MLEGVWFALFKGAAGKAWLRTCRCEEVNYVDHWGKRVPAETSRCKGPEAGLCPVCPGTSEEVSVFGAGRGRGRRAQKEVGEVKGVMQPDQGLSVP